LKSKFKKIILLIAIIVLLFFLFNPGSSSHRIDIIGSTSVQPIAEELATVYSKDNPNLLINVQGGGSGMGIRSIQQKIADIGISSKKLYDEDNENITKLELGYEGIVICVNHENNISNLSKQQLKDIFSGKINNWQDVGGSDCEIHVLTRESGSGTLTSFNEIVMNGDKIKSDAITQSSTNAIEQTVANDEKAIGYVSYTTVSDSVKKLLSIDGVEISDETIANGSYALTRPYLLLIHDHENKYVKDFLSWVFSPEGIELLKHEKIISPNEKELETNRNTINNISVY
jgi:phosphate transport system substrate-binding protein